MITIGVWSAASVLSIVGLGIVACCCPDQQQQQQMSVLTGDSDDKPKRICPDCGIENPPEADYCGDCGFEFK